MAEQKVLFHNPQVFNDQDLRNVRANILMNKALPLTSTAIVAVSLLGVLSLRGPVKIYNYSLHLSQAQMM